MGGIRDRKIRGQMMQSFYNFKKIVTLVYEAGGTDILEQKLNETSAYSSELAKMGPE